MHYSPEPLYCLRRSSAQLLLGNIFYNGPLICLRLLCVRIDIYSSISGAHVPQTMFGPYALARAKTCETDFSMHDGNICRAWLWYFVWCFSRSFPANTNANQTTCTHTHTHLLARMCHRKVLSNMCCLRHLGLQPGHRRQLAHTHIRSADPSKQCIIAYTWAAASV